MSGGTLSHMPTHPWRLWGYRHVGAAMPLGAPRHRWRDHRIQGYINDLAAAL